jgi:putative transposase
MVVTQRMPLYLSGAELNMVTTASKEAARLWNDIVQAANVWWRHTGRWMYDGHIDKLFKSNKYNLHSQTIQGIRERYCSVRSATAARRRNGDKKCKYPYKQKRFVTVPLKQMAIKPAPGGIRLTLCRGKCLFVQGDFPGIRTCELVFNHRRRSYDLLWTHEVDEDAPVTTGKACGVDIGSVYAAVCVTETGEALMSTGRGLRSIKRRENKGIAQLDHLISRCKNGSKRRRKLIKAKNKMLARCERQKRDALHKVARAVVNHAIAAGCDTIVVGDPKGVEQNTRKKKKLNRTAAQQVSEMEYGRLKQYINYKARLAGLTCAFINESWTSQRCPVCGHCHKPKGREYVCPKCGYAAHRDVVGAYNILRKYKKAALPRAFDIRARYPLKYLRYQRSRAA